MADLELVFNEESGVWEERPEPYTTIECETKEDFEYIQSALEHFANHGRWEPHPKHPGFDRCSVCHDCIIANDWADGIKWKYCPQCGARMDLEVKEDV